MILPQQDINFLIAFERFKYMTFLNPNITEEDQIKIYEVTATIGSSPYRIIDFNDGINLGVQVNWKYKNSLDFMWRSTGPKYVEVHDGKSHPFSVNINEIGSFLFFKDFK